MNDEELRALEGGKHVEQGDVGGDVVVVHGHGYGRDNAGEDYRAVVAARPGVVGDGAEQVEHDGGGQNAYREQQGGGKQGAVGEAEHREQT